MPWRLLLVVLPVLVSLTVPALARGGGHSGFRGGGVSVIIGGHGSFRIASGRVGGFTTPGFSGGFVTPGVSSSRSGAGLPPISGRSVVGTRSKVVRTTVRRPIGIIGSTNRHVIVVAPDSGILDRRDNVLQQRNAERERRLLSRPRGP
jgi:hypothetical protein